MHTIIGLMQGRNAPIALVTSVRQGPMRFCMPYSVPTVRSLRAPYCDQERCKRSVHSSIQVKPALLGFGLGICRIAAFNIGFPKLSLLADTIKELLYSILPLARETRRIMEIPAKRYFGKTVPSDLMEKK
jgi:hypothetical protein